MPVPSFLASFADKAQSAINASPLAGYAHPTDSAANEPGGHRSHTLGSLQNQLRAFGQQYASTTPVQKIITIEKSVAIDLDSISRDTKAQSKELYTWGQSELEDIKDVTDRLAYLNFVQGSLAGTLALKLDSARAPLKALRDAEANLAPRRNIRAGLQYQLSKLEHDQQKGAEKRIAELKDQIKKVELEGMQHEKEVELLKRKAVRESEQLKWEAMREYGEKLALLSQAATPIIGALPPIPPSPANPYVGAQATGAARASLQRALDNYKTGHINLPPQLSGSDLHRSDTRSFGESHASELSSIASDTTSPGIPSTPPHGGEPLSDAPPKPAEDASSTQGSSSTPINPADLNQTPAAIPTPASDSPHQSPPPSDVPAQFQSSNAPTVAETGAPVSAGASGPGPSSGSLLDIRHDAAPANAPPPAAEAPHGFESAAEEKKRLQAAYSTAPGSGEVQHESAEDEKKRLEREEREKLLRNPTGHDDAAGKERDEDLPPYQDM